MSTSISTTDPRLAGLAASFGGTTNSAFTDFIKIVNASPAFIQQLSAYLESNPTVGIETSPTLNLKGADNQSFSAAGITDPNTRVITVATLGVSSDLTSTAGYQLARTIAHELGHFKDLQTTSNDKTIGEARAEINAYTLMNDAITNLIAAHDTSATSSAPKTDNMLFRGNPLDDGQPFTSESDFSDTQAIIKSFLNNPVTATLASTCGIDTACEAAVATVLLNNEYKGYYPNDTAPQLLGQNAGYQLFSDPINSNNINIVDTQTGQIIQTISAQTFDDGSALISVMHQGGGTSTLSIDSAGASKETDHPVTGDDITETIVNRDAENNILNSENVAKNSDGTITTTKVDYHPDGVDCTFDTIVSQPGAPDSIWNEVSGTEDLNGNIIDATVSGHGAIVDVSGAGDNTSVTIESGASAIVIEGNGSHNDITLQGNDPLYIESGSANLHAGQSHQITVGADADVRDMDEDDSFYIMMGGILVYDYDSGDGYTIEGSATVRMLAYDDPESPPYTEEIDRFDSNGKISTVDRYSEGTLLYTESYTNGIETKYVNYDLAYDPQGTSETDYYPGEQVTSVDGVVTSIFDYNLDTGSLESLTYFDPMTGIRTDEAHFDENGYETVSYSYDTNTGQMDREIFYTPNSGAPAEANFYNPATGQLEETDFFNGGEHAYQSMSYADSSQVLVTTYNPDTGIAISRDNYDSVTGQKTQTSLFDENGSLSQTTQYTDGVVTQLYKFNSAGSVIEEDQFNPENGRLTQVSTGEGGHFTQIDTYDADEFKSTSSTLDADTGELLQESVFSTTTHRLSQIYYFNGGPFAYQVDGYNLFGLYTGRNTYNPNTGIYLYGTYDGTANHRSTFAFTPPPLFNGGNPFDPFVPPSIFTVQVLGFGPTELPPPPPPPSIANVASTQLHQLIDAMASFAPPAGSQTNLAAANDAQLLHPPMLAAAH